MKQSVRMEDVPQRIRRLIVASASSPSVSQPQSNQPAGSFWRKVWNSLDNSIGEIVFGIEDGTVSIFGLVFGLAASAANSHQVLLAGASGAVAAAVSMMAGTYLDVESTQAKAQAEMEHEREEIHQTPQPETADIKTRLTNGGFNQAEVTQILTALERRPEALLLFEEATELQISQAEHENPVVKSLWMFLADLFAASIPVILFAQFALAMAQIVSLGITLLLLVALGIARGLIGRRNVLTTPLQTVVIAAAAAAAGVLIGKWISG